MAVGTAVRLSVNGAPVTCAVEPGRSLLDCLREHLAARAVAPSNGTRP